MRRGYSVLAADLLPHVGARFHNEEIPPEKMTAGWGIDRALEAVVDYALSRDDVQPEQLAIVGYSAGGTFAGRAVIRDRRLKALVADSPLYDLHELMAEEFPTVLQKVPRLLGNAFVNAVTSRNEKAAIVLERSAWQVGADNVFGLMQAARDLTFDPRNIPCPTLCLTGAAESEIFKRQARHTYDVLDVPHKELHVFTAEEGADAHCQLNNLTLMQRVMFDWLDDVFARQPGFRAVGTEDRGTTVPPSN
jgi:pimeloyl-ACP methyl ester carboxylesterase